jgi:hypothetical protein
VSDGRFAHHSPMTDFAFAPDFPAMC